MIHKIINLSACMSINLKIICLVSSALFLSGCSEKTPSELIQEYENKLADQKLTEAIVAAELLSKTKEPEVNLITFHSEPVPPYFIELHKENGLDVSSVETGYAPRPNLPTVNTQIDLPSEATRTIATMDAVTAENATLGHDNHNH